MEKKEYILCAAIWYNDGLKHDSQPVNIETGFVVCGRRHHNCYATVVNIASLNEAIKLKITNIENTMSKEEYNKHQGFITSLDRYVDRKEAWIIAKENNQITWGLEDTTDEIKIKGLETPNNSDRILISEHLY